MSNRYEKIINYLDVAVELLDRGELSPDEVDALNNFMDEIQRTESIDGVRVTKNGKSTLTLLPRHGRRNGI